MGASASSCLYTPAAVGVRRVPVPTQQVITGAARWCLRYGLSYRDVEELLAERGVEVHHVIRRRRRRGTGGYAGVEARHVVIPHA